jgi:hypothetical protein
MGDMCGVSGWVEVQNYVLLPQTEREEVPSWFGDSARVLDGARCGIHRPYLTAEPFNEGEVETRVLTDPCRVDDRAFGDQAGGDPLAPVIAAQTFQIVARHDPGQPGDDNLRRLEFDPSD